MTLNVPKNLPVGLELYYLGKADSVEFCWNCRIKGIIVYNILYNRI